MSLFQPQVQEKKDLTKKLKPLTDEEKQEILLIGCDSAVYAFEDFNKYPRLISNSHGDVDGFAVYRDEIYHCNGNGKIVKTLTDEVLVDRGHAEDICVHEGKLYDTGKNGKQVVNTETSEVLANFFGDEGYVRGMCSHRGGLFVATGNMVYDVFSQRTIVERPKWINKLFSYRGELYDMGEYEGIWNTFNDTQVYRTQDEGSKFGLFAFKGDLFWVNEINEIRYARGSNSKVDLPNLDIEIYSAAVVDKKYFRGKI